MLCYSSQRDDPGEIPQHSGEAQEVAAACRQDILGTGTMLPNAHLSASWREAGGCTSRTDVSPALGTLHL